MSHEVPYERTSIDFLLNKTIQTVIGGQVSDDHLIFAFEDGTMGSFVHRQECCESVSIVDCNGTLTDLIGRKLVLSEEYSENCEDCGESGTYTFYRFRDDKGDNVDVRWLGESNGYYSESVDFVTIEPSPNFVKPTLEEFIKTAKAIDPPKRRGDKKGKLTPNGICEAIIIHLPHLYPTITHINSTEWIVDWLKSNGQFRVANVNA